MANALIWTLTPALLSYLLFALPVTFVFYAANGRFGLGVGIFAYGGANRRARRSARARKMPGRPFAGTVPALVQFVLKRVHVEHIAFSGSVHLENAMHTALLTGVLHAVSGASGGKISCTATPDFSNGSGALAVSGMMRTRLGHIILLGKTVLISRIKEKYAIWKSTRLKGS